MNKLKIVAASVGGVFVVAHIGLLGYVFRQEPEPVIQPPTFHIPRGPYSSYRINYSIGSNLSGS